MGPKVVASASASAAGAGTAALVYLMLSGRLSSPPAGGEDGAAEASRRRRRSSEREEGRWPERAPASWRESAAVAVRTVRFTYGETLGKWSLGDIAFGIKHFMRVQSNLQHEYTGRNCVPLEGAGVRQELISLLRYLRLCLFFSKKPYEVFLEFGGYEQSDILIRNSKSKLMKPAFTVIREESTKCFLIFIHGAISFQDRLTAATAAEVPFHHAVLQGGRVSNIIVGHAHCGMVAAARWIADQAIPCLSRAVEPFPDYSIKIIGHSMGAGIAAILTYILREDKNLPSCSCIAFGPAACMTWDLAEFGKDFVTTVVNRNDLVPSFGTVSADSLRAEVMASSWAPNLQEQIQQTEIVGFANRSVSFVRSHIHFVSSEGSKVADVDMFLPHTPEAETKLSADVTAMKEQSALSYWSFAAINRQALESVVNPIGSNAALMSTYLAIERDTLKPTAELVSSSLKEIDKEEREIDDEHMKEHMPSSSQKPLQLYPPGRIMRMVVLPAPEDGNSREQGSQNEVVALYETPRSMYNTIRLSRFMIRDHYMPRYIETMEMLVDKLAEDDGR